MKKKLVLAYSGGLDTSYCLKKLSKDGFEVHAVSVNTGGFNDKEIKNQQDNALKIGATKYTSLNGLDNYYNISKDCIVASYCLIWTVIYIRLI